MSVLQTAARVAAYLIVLLLAAVWTAGALASLLTSLFDIGRPHVGDAIVALGRLLGLSPAGTVTLAHLLAGLKLMLGLYLFATVAVAAFDWVMDRKCDDALLDVGLLMSALASVVAGLPVAGLGGVPLQGLIGELMLCAIANALAIHGRGFVVPVERPPLQRPEPVIIHTP